MDMAHNSKQAEPMPQLLEKTSEQEKSTEDVNFKMRRSFSWDRAFFTSDGFLDDDELSSVIEGGGDDLKHQLQEIEEIESLEAKLFQDIEASTIKSNDSSKPIKHATVSSKGTDLAATTQASKVTRVGSSTPIETQPISNNVKSSSATLARRNTSSKTGKPTTDSPSKTPVGTATKNKVPPINNSVYSPRTSTPVSPISPRSSVSSSSTSAVKRSSRGSSVPRRSSEKSSATNARRMDDQKTGKLAGGLMHKTPSSISLKNKPPPLNSHPSSPLGLSNSSPTTSLTSSESSSTCTVDQRSISRSRRGTSVHQRSLNRDASAKSTLKNHPTSQTPDRNSKQQAPFRLQTGSISRPTPKIGFNDERNSCKSSLFAGLSKSGSPKGAKTRKLPSSKTVESNTGLKPNSQKITTHKPSKNQSSDKSKSSSSSPRGVTNILIMSPEILDLKGKLNALKMEISMQKNKQSSGKGESSSSICTNSSCHVGIVQTDHQA